MHSHNKKYIDSLDCYFFLEKKKRKLCTHIYMNTNLPVSKRELEVRNFRNKNLTKKILIFSISALTQT